MQVGNIKLSITVENNYEFPFGNNKKKLSSEWNFNTILLPSSYSNLKNYIF